MGSATHPSLARRLNPKEEAIVADERRLLSELEVALSAFGVPAEQQQILRRSIEQLDTLFLLVIVGEFNAGKSAFVNALLGERVLEEGATPTTTHVTVLQHGSRETDEVLESGLRRVFAPLEVLQRLHVVDTPGTNAVIREHERLTSQFVPRADLVLFVTSADRPFTESERAFLEHIRAWGKKILVVVNKVDILETESDVARVREFVLDNARKLLGETPPLFLVSARAAQKAKQGDPSRWEPSGFGPLERYISTTLDETSRLRLKLQNPLGVAVRLVDEHAAGVRDRRELLADDLAMLDDLDRELGQYAQDMARDFGLRMTAIEHVLSEMERRGHEFFDETLRVGRILDLVNKSRVQQAFEQEVVADTPERIERLVRELIDWMVDAEFRQWEAVTRHVAERQRAYRERIVGGGASSRFHNDRGRLIESLASETQRVVDTFDRQREAEAMAEGARNAVAGALAMGAGALGLGTLVTIAASTAAADITGILTASVLAAVGFFVIPAKRRQAKQEMKQKVSAVRERLSRSLHAEFEGEMQRGLGRIRDEVAPYARFVRGESARLAETGDTLARIRSGLDALRARIETL
jgi:small GTP-binding protein